MLPAETTDQLALYSQAAIAVAGFAGVIGAFSEFRMHSEATAFRVRSMVSLAVGLMLMALLPMTLANFRMVPALLWHIAGTVLSLVVACLLVFLGRAARRLYARGHLMRRAAYVLVALGVAALVPLAMASAGIGDFPVEPWYFVMLNLGMALCAYHFVLLIYAVRLDRSE